MALLVPALPSSENAGRITGGPIINVRADVHTVARFEVDSNQSVDSAISPARGCIINPASFTITIGPATTGMPASLGSTVPCIVLRDNDPAVDAFFISNSADQVGGTPLNAGTGITMRLTFLRSLSISIAFPSRNILDSAHRSFGFEDMSRNDWIIGVAGGGLLLVTGQMISIENLTTRPSPQQTTTRTAALTSVESTPSSSTRKPAAPKVPPPQRSKHSGTPCFLLPMRGGTGRLSTHVQQRA